MYLTLLAFHKVTYKYMYINIVDLEMMKALNGEARVFREMIEGAGLIIFYLNEIHS